MDTMGRPAQRPASIPPARRGLSLLPVRKALKGTAGVVALLVPLSAAAQQVTLRALAITGDSAPVSGATWAAFTNPLISSAGSGVFGGQVAGSGIDSTNNQALWVWQPGGGAPSLLARTGSPMPGVTGVAVQLGTKAVFTGQLAYAFTGSQIVFDGEFGASPQAPNPTCALWSGPTTGVSVRAIEGTTASNGGTWATCFGAGPINSSGAFSILTTMGPTAPGGYSDGAWLDESGTLVPVATYNQGTSAGQPAPGTSAVFADGSPPLLNDSGQVFFSGLLQGSGVVSGTNDVGLWFGLPGTLALVARTGDVAPGTGGKTFSFLNTDSISVNCEDCGIALNVAGHVAFHGKIAGVTSSTQGGIWGGQPSNPSLLVQAGTTAPGLGSNAFLYFYDVALNARDDIAFFTNLDPEWGDANATNASCVYAGQPSALWLVAREGSQAPGLPTGVQFAGFGTNLQVQIAVNDVVSVRHLWLSDDGRLVFPASLQGTGVTSANNASYWGYVPGRGLLLIARTGEPLPGGVAGSRMLSRIFVATGANGADGAATPFNNSGQFAFRAEFADGSSGLFVASLPSVTAWPAPTAASLQPPSGPGGTLVTISGTNFLPTATVTFGGVAAIDVQYVDSSTLTAYVPSSGYGLVDVVVTHPDGQHTSPLQFAIVSSGAPFTDEPLVPGKTVVKAVHITELRQRIDSLRLDVGLQKYSWTDPTLTAHGTRIRAVHVMELRAALANVYTQVSYPPPTYTDSPVLAKSTTVSVKHINELRAAVLALGG